ncbi:MAG: hypothetical protein OHK0017_13870 [Patescibacteria group bacterium]
MAIKFLDAKMAVEEIIAKYNLLAPIKVFDLGDAMGINWDVLNSASLLAKIVENGDWNQVKNVNILDVLGYLSVKDNTFFINDDNNPMVRRRFTFAHELGHYILDQPLTRSLFRVVTPKQLDTVDEATSLGASECRANYFAEMLLMPDRDIFTRLILCGNCTTKDEVFSLLASLFVVSAETAKRRVHTFMSENSVIWESFRVSHLFE